MKITKRQLRRIIKEEKAKLLREEWTPQPDATNFKVGTILQDKYGEWTITNVTTHDGEIWYDVDNDRGSKVVYPSQIGRDYTVVG